ncbi:hypothetical protein EDC56_0860 [Sinobacterium caligoides]|uniref:MAPEG family protein n=1 Tax=Sinobacterium caligoides TaxID=933926 RepID=A0A3N2DZQ7_9GAMM|nr:MAPEG family protein [Sinobacterium caligoides]ROS05330.1 hypothetical protein EDC56_0860 [Sinobacterium caligoides]
MSIPLLCIVLMIVLCLSTGFAVSWYRGAYNVFAGYDSDPSNTLYKLVRAHANSCEFVPVFAVLIYLLSLQQQPDWVLWFTIAATFCRFSIVIGMIAFKTMAKPNIVRFIGGMGSYVAGFGLCYALLLQSLG